MRKTTSYVIAGTTLMLLIGIVYSYSLFRLEIEETYHVAKVMSGAPYMVVLLFYAIFMAIGGYFFQKYPTSYIAITGSILISSGFLIAGFANSMIVIIISYGVLIGSGIGLLYGLPLRIVAQLNHPRPGLLTGITLMGFGLSPLVFAPLVELLIDHVGLSSTFQLFGVIYLVLLLGISGYLAKQDKQPIIVVKNHYDILRKSSFYFLFGLFFIATFIGLSIIGLTANIGKEVVLLDPNIIPLYIAFFSIFNGIGRPLMGYANDHLGFKPSAIISFVTLFFAFVLLYFMASVQIVFILALIIIYMNFGGWLSLAASSTMKLFGKESYSQNYGIMFLAYGLGAFIGSFVSSIIIDYFSFATVFLLMGLLSLVGLLVVYFAPIRKEKRA